MVWNDGQSLYEWRTHHVVLNDLCVQRQPKTKSSLRSIFEGFSINFNIQLFMYDFESTILEFGTKNKKINQKVNDSLTWSISPWNTEYYYRQASVNPAEVLETSHHRYIADYSVTFQHILWNFEVFLERIWVINKWWRAIGIGVFHQSMNWFDWNGPNYISNSIKLIKSSKTNEFNHSNYNKKKRRIPFKHYKHTQDSFLTFVHHANTTS